MRSLALIGVVGLSWLPGLAWGIEDRSPLAEKAAYFEQDLLDKHWLDGLFVSIVNSAPHGTKLPHTVNEPGNVIHAAVWTGRYLGGVGYQYAVTRDPRVRELGGQILRALRVDQEVTGKPGLLARGFVKGHGPVADYERDGGDSKEWRQGQGAYADYRFYGDVSVDNFNAVLYGYAIYFDLAADDEQKKFIAFDVDRLMTHLLDNHCRIIDLDGEPTLYGHVGIDPDPARDEYYTKLYSQRRRRPGAATSVAESPLRSSLMLLPDLLIAHHITGKPRYIETYRKVIDRFKNNPEPDFFRRPMTLERLATLDHSPEGQQYEALYNLIRYEQDPELLQRYRAWVLPLWENNWTEGNSVFTYTTLALLPTYRDAAARQSGKIPDVPHAAEGLQLARESLEQFKIDRVFRPVMNSLNPDIEVNPFSKESRRQLQSARPLPMKLRPLDNEYVWKGNPYHMDGWLKPTITAMQFSSDDPQVAWFSDSAGRAYMTLDRGQTWRNLNNGLMGASVKNLAAAKDRTFVIWAQSGNGNFISRDGGLSWRPAPDSGAPEFAQVNPREWLKVLPNRWLKINDAGELVLSTDDGQSSRPAMAGWRIPRATSLFATPWGVIAGGPGGAYRSDDGTTWTEISLWREQEVGAADFLHAYWMGRYYGFLN